MSILNRRRKIRQKWNERAAAAAEAAEPADSQASEQGAEPATPAAPSAEEIARAQAVLEQAKAAGVAI